ncbi:MAG: P27 family phage terminase small subunit [Chloroflexi bacterium]|nr:P27 family phage terminase small subunit [Chloroflexota bacterium]
MADDKLKAPKHLRAATRRWFNAVAEDYVLEAHHVRLLTLACESWDRCQQARELLKRDGLVTQDRFGQLRQHPAVAIERDSRIAFARLLRELALDVEPPGESRPPLIGANGHLRRGR